MAQARPMISVIIPTITGREDYLKMCVEGYETTAPGAELIVIENEPSCGHAWIKGAEQARGLYLHFTADDITPNQNWWPDAVKAADMGGVPIANVFASNGMPLMCDSPLGDMGLVKNVLVPFLSRKMLDQGGWLLPIHYGSDDWVSYVATQRKIPLHTAPSYSFTHWVADQGRDYTRRHGDIFKLVEAMGQAGYVPPVYSALEERLRTSVTGLDNVRIRDLDRMVAKQLRQQAEGAGWNALQ